MHMVPNILHLTCVMSGYDIITNIHVFSKKQCSLNVLFLFSIKKISLLSEILGKGIHFKVHVYVDETNSIHEYTNRLII